MDLEDIAVWRGLAFALLPAIAMWAALGFIVAWLVGWATAGGLAP